MQTDKRDEAFRQQVLFGNLWLLILKVCLPLALYQGLQQGFKVLDTLIASFISGEAVSAVAYLSQIITLLLSLGGGLAVGGSIKISEAYGKGDYALVRRRVSTLMAVCIGLGALLLVVVLPLGDHVLALAGTPREIVEIGRTYFAIEAAAMAVAFFNNAYIAVERVRGNTVRILWLNLGFTAIKLSLTAWFVYGRGSDITGIAVASLAAQLSLAAAALFFLRDRQSAFGFSFRCISARREVLHNMVVISVPVVAERISFSLGKVIVNAMSGVYGALTVGALGISNNIGGICNSLQVGFQEGSVGIFSQNMAVGNTKRVLRAFYILVAINSMIGAVMFVLTNLYIRQISFWFSNSAQGLDPAFQKLIMDIYLLDSIGGCIPLGITAAVIALLLGLGYTRQTLYINFSRLFLFRMPVLWFLQRFTTMGSISVGVVMLVSNLLVSIMAALMGWRVLLRLKAGS